MILKKSKNILLYTKYNNIITLLKCVFNTYFILYNKLYNGND